MLIRAFLKVALAIVSSQALPAQQSSLDPEMSALFQGNFACKGNFASGKPIEADVSFASQLDGKWLAYSHTDRPPNRYKAIGHWGVDSESKKLLMLLVDVAGGARVFSSEGWKDGAITFERTPFPGQRERKERFRFEKQPDAAFKMTYETASGADWKLGDFIVCAH
jgi:hypothetical protein